ncbi:MAG: hypothetical protein WHS89_10420 [Acidimicrobiales bacterium]
MTPPGVAGRSPWAPSVAIEDDAIVVHAPAYTDQPIHLSIEAVAAVVDLRDRRARRLPGPMLLGREPAVAGIATASPQSPLSRATLGLAFRHPLPLPETRPGAPWDQPASGSDRPDRWDVLAINAGKQTDQILVTFARRGTPRLPTLASGLTLAVRDRLAGSDGQGPRSASATARSESDQTVTVATLCLVLVAVLTVLMALITSSLGWLVVLAIALPVHLFGTASQTRRGRRLTRRRVGPPSVGS